MAIPRWNSLAEVMDQKTHIFDMLHRNKSARHESELGCEDIRRIQNRGPCTGYWSEFKEFVLNSTENGRRMRLGQH